MVREKVDAVTVEAPCPNCGTDGKVTFSAEERLAAHAHAHNARPMRGVRCSCSTLGLFVILAPPLPMNFYPVTAA